MNDEGPALAGLGVPTMVERVARAIEADLDTFPMLSADPATIRRIRAEKLARAAIEAMREPTDEMIDAASSGFAKEALDYRERNTNAFQAAIDAALSSSEAES
jgi:hypothetical protein